MADDKLLELGQKTLVVQAVQQDLKSGAVAIANSLKRSHMDSGCVRCFMLQMLVCHKHPLSIDYRHFSMLLGST